jgi:clan AA aspartic protease (TIGR02281 family)
MEKCQTTTSNEQAYWACMGGEGFASAAAQSAAVEKCQGYGQAYWTCMAGEGYGPLATHPPAPVNNTYVPSPPAPPPAPAPNPSLHTVQLTHTDGGFILPVTIGGLDIATLRLHAVVTETFLLDTGASKVTLPVDLAERLIDLGVFEGTPQLASAQLADGSTVPSIAATLRAIKVGDLIVRDVPCMIGPRGTSLLLGQSFLQKFSAWGIANGSNTLMLKT